MMKAQNKNRKHPTCSRCRFHGKKDIRVLQHQCPFRNCTCSSCFLIKAQKNLDKHEDNSNDTESPVGSVDSTLNSPNYKESIPSISSVKSVPIVRSPDGPSETANFGTPVPAAVNSSQGWEPMEQIPHHSTIGTTSSKTNEYYKIGDFQSLCLTFPDYKPSQLQTFFEQCGKDFQKTIDRILMTKWCSDGDVKPSLPFQNNNDWSALNHSSGDYASGVGACSAVFPSSTMYHNDGTASNNVYHHANNTDQCIDWRSNSYSTTNEEYYGQECIDANEFYYEQNFQAYGALSQSQGMHNQSSYPNWTYDSYWYGNSQGNSCGTMYDVNGRTIDDDTLWQNGMGHGHGHGQGDVALGQSMHGISM